MEINAGGADASQPFLEVNSTSESEIAKDVMDEIRQWTTAQTNLDVYQMNSFYSGTSTRCTWSEKSAIIINVYKTCVAFFIQTVGAIYVAHRAVYHHAAAVKYQEDIVHAFCKPSENGYLTWMAFALTAFLSFTINDELTALHKHGVYKFKKHALPAFFSKCWLAVGILANVGVLLVVWAVSVTVIFMATEPLEMILNTLAAYFLIQLGELMVTRNDYEHVQTWIEDNYVGWRQQQIQRYRHHHTHTCCHKCGQCWLDCSLITDTFVFKGLIRLIAAALPFLVLVCFNPAFSGLPLHYDF